MKLFSILNKPAAKAGNKQAGLVFLEYVIMAFIVTVAVICVLWWFYWHLQQMTWEVKQKLDTLKTLNCELGKPGGPESVQPTPALGFPYEITKYDIDQNYPSDLYKYIPIAIPYNWATFTINNIDIGKDFRGSIDFFDANNTYFGSFWFDTTDPSPWTDLLEGGSQTFSINLSAYALGPYHIGIDPFEYYGDQYTALVSVNVTEFTP